MSISDGQPVNAAASNAAFMSRTVDTSTVGKVALQESGSGAIGDIQKLTNAIMSDIGRATEVDATSKDYSSNNIVSNGDDRKVAIGKLDAEFDSTTGHNHDGSAGSGGNISAADLIDVNNFFAEYQSVNFNSAAGLNDDVSSLFLGKTPGGNSSQAGVVTATPNNLVHIVDQSTLTFIEDAGGQRVYGRLTESAGIWTLTYYTNEAGTETAHSLASTNIKIIYLEVFTQETRPTFTSSPMEFGTLDVTADVIDAGPLNRGVLNSALSPQTLGGNKVWNGSQDFIGAVKMTDAVNFDLFNDSTAGTSVTLSSNAKTIRRLTGALVSIAGITPSGVEAEVKIVINKTGSSVNILHDAATTNGFFLQNDSTFTFRNNTSIFIQYNLTDDRWVIVGGGGSPFDLDAFGSSPNGDGASYNPSTGSFVLQPADASNPGGLSELDQVFPAGNKSFSQNLGLSQVVNSTLNGSNAHVLATTATHIIFTNGALVSIDRMEKVSTGFAWLRILTNQTGNSVTIINDTGTPTDERILTGTGSNLVLTDKASLLLAYNDNASKWQIIGGSGGESSGFTVGSILSIANAGTIAISSSERLQYIKVVCNTSNTTAVTSATPFGATPPPSGSIIKLMGTSDTDRVQLNYSDIANGVIINGQADLGAYNMIEFIYDGTAGRYIECSRNF